MSNGWWGKKLQATQPGGIQVGPQHYPQQQYVQPQPIAPPQQPVIQQMQVQEIDGAKVSYLEMARAHDGEKISKYWKGGEAMRTEGNLGCPQCGSTTSFTAYSGQGGMAAGIAGNRPRPHCFECGYNGLFAQGEQSNWV